MAETIARVLDRALAERPDAPAVVARSGRLTYRQLDLAADLAAAALADLGLHPGDRLAASLPNDLDVVVAFHGAMRLGLVWVGLNTALAPAEKAHLLAHCGARVLLTDPATAGTLASLRSQLPELGAVVTAVGGDPECEWRRLLARAATPPRVDVDPHAPAGIAYTSGTTGLPRGIVHSQHNLLLPGAVLVAERGYDERLRKGDCLPLTILNLMVLTTLLTAQAGGCCVVMDRRDAEGVIDWIRAQQVNVWNGVPTQLYDLARSHAARRADLATLWEVWSGGGDCPGTLREAFLDAFGLPLRATYGLTEAPTVVSIDPVGERWSPGGSGQVLPHLQLRVLDDAGNDVPSGELGELCLQAAPTGRWASAWTPMLGEWEDGAVVPHQGLLRTGDLGAVDADGWLSIRDRRKLVVVRGGANIYPAEVERVLLSVPGVQAAAAFGIPDERLGEQLAAVVQCAPDNQVAVDALVEACATRLARYKVPERWAVVDALPCNAMGKVVRAELPALLDEAPARG